MKQQMQPGDDHQHVSDWNIAPHATEVQQPPQKESQSDINAFFLATAAAHFKHGAVF